MKMMKMTRWTPKRSDAVRHNGRRVGLLDIVDDGWKNEKGVRYAEAWCRGCSRLLFVTVAGLARGTTVQCLACARVKSSDGFKIREGGQTLYEIAESMGATFDAIYGRWRRGERGDVLRRPIGTRKSPTNRKRK